MFEKRQPDTDFNLKPLTVDIRSLNFKPGLAANSPDKIPAPQPESVIVDITRQASGSGDESFDPGQYKRQNLEGMSDSALAEIYKILKERHDIDPGDSKFYLPLLEAGNLLSDRLPLWIDSGFEERGGLYMRSLASRLLRSAGEARADSDINGARPLLQRVGLGILDCAVTTCCLLAPSGQIKKLMHLIYRDYPEVRVKMHDELLVAGGKLLEATAGS